MPIDKFGLNNYEKNNVTNKNNILYLKLLYFEKICVNSN